MHAEGPEILVLPALADNYAFLLRDTATGTVAAIDTPDAAVIADVLRARGWGLDLILNTHHHPDHIGGNLALKAAFGAKVIGPAAEAHRISGLDHAVDDGEIVHVGSVALQVLSVPGHTAGHIAYASAAAMGAEAGGLAFAFVGDTLFGFGCGRLFEGTPAQMWASLCRLRALAPATAVYTAHEYTLGNARFAATIDPDHAPFVAARAEAEALRAAGRPTIPRLLATEQAANPFLRADDPALAARLGLAGEAPATVFARLRGMKDRFTG